jgi:hypothetical protein
VGAGVGHGRHRLVAPGARGLGGSAPLSDSRPSETLRGRRSSFGDSPPAAADRVDTPFHRHWGSDTYLGGEHPFLTRAAAEWLRDAGAALVGVDVPDGARFYAVPPPIEGMGTFPVRAFAVAG